MNNNHKKYFATKAFKYFLTISSLAGTITLWNFFANQDNTGLSGQAEDQNYSSQDVSLSPLPTLVPLVNIEISSLPTNDQIGMTTQTEITLPIRSIPQPTQAPIMNGQSNPNPVIIPAPVTTTRSSRP